MRLVSWGTRLRTLETSASQRERRSAAAGGVGLIWSAHEARVSVEDLGPGEYVAIDLDVDDWGNDVQPMQARITERVSYSAEDRGYVRHGGRVVGRVASVIDRLLKLDLAEPPEASE